MPDRKPGQARPQALRRLNAADEVARLGCGPMGSRATVTGLCQRLGPPPGALNLDPGPPARLLRRRRMP